MGYLFNKSFRSARFRYENGPSVLFDRLKAFFSV